MKRIDRICDYLEENTKKLKLEEVIGGKGFTASDIAQELNILRNNVSKELKELVSLGEIIRIKGRPVRHLHKESTEEILNIKLPKESIEVNSVDEILDKKEENNPFQFLIGAEGSLKNQIEQAKAAILYPPNGLHTLILGQTGVGKTLFANMMYNYAKCVNRFHDKSPFIVFNCADYYNNPQLLISHIFGHSKGAFTGADSEKVGLVEKANGGILFLDEIHRLPPEGQEMLFYFMDTGTYNKLGETERGRKASVLIIGATTEDPISYMLKTFIRRIPIIINIPSLEERSTREKIDIIRYLFSKESHRVSKQIKVPADIIKALIGSTTFGNIGQLKSNIQLICAKGFLNCMKSSSQCIELEFKMLPQNIKNGLFEIGKRRQEFEEIGQMIHSPFLIDPEGYKIILEEDPYELSFNLYELIKNKAKILKQEGMDDEYINKFIATDINVHIKSFYKKFQQMKNKKEEILKIVDEDILEFAEEIKDLAEKKLKKQYRDRFVYALGLHLSAFLKRIREHKYIQEIDIDEVSKKEADEFKIALEIKERIEEKYDISVPEAEVGYIALLLNSAEDIKEGKVGIVVAAHGNSTATSMVQVAVKLLGEGPICAVDMPLEVSPKEILEVIVDKVKQMDSGRGVLLLVDMGSLYNFESTLIERTGSKIKTIDMVSTVVVIEAIRKAFIFDMHLEDIYNSFKEVKKENGEAKEKEKGTNQVIITICSSGEGTAVKLKQLVKDIVLNLTKEQIRVLPVGVRDLENKIIEIQKKHKIICAVGVKKPDLKVPFIPLEMLIDGNGEKVLEDVIVHKSSLPLPHKENIVVKDLCEDSLKEFLTFLNPYKILSMLLQFIDTLEQEMDTEFSNSMKIRMAIHVACALERMVIQDGLQYSGELHGLNKEVLKAIHKACKIFENSLNIVLTEDEKYYIYEILSV